MSSQHILLFEDDAVADLDPVVATRPAFELRYGLWNLRERVEVLVPETSRHAVVRSLLRNALGESLPDWSSVRPTEGRVLLLNARALADRTQLETLWSSLDRDVVVRAEGALVYAVADASRVDALLDPSSALDVSTDAGPVEIELARGLWDHVRRNGAQICEDFRTLSAYGVTPRRIFATRFAESSPRAARLKRTRYGGVELGVVHPGVHLIEPDSILFGEDCQVRPGVVLDASEGPIVLGSGVEVHSMSVVVGPCSLGPGTLVQPGTRLREGTSVGAFCKVGGEVEDSILLDLSNKQHDGFLGHAYVGQWVNLGADTNGSDLKNNYAPVRVDFGTRQIDTGETFVGPLLGDHVKTSINTMLNTGSVVGTGSNLFGADFPPRFVPPFAWGGADAMVEYRLDRALQTARAVLARREVEWTAAYQTLLEELFASTAPLREGRAPRAS